MKTMPPAQFIDAFGGTVIHVTMRDEDCGPAFLSMLDSVDLDAANKIRAKYPRIDDAGFDADILLADNANVEEAYRHIHECIAAIEDALNAACPPGVYFGSTEGDGSDFGYWLSESEE